LPSGQDVPPPTIKRGDVGEDVKVVQIWLGLVDDGVFGPVLEQEVIKFQRANGLEDDGIVGPKTWEVLDAKFDNANEVKSDLETYIGDLVSKATALRADLDAFVTASQKEKTE
jgi:peptidoglycan hydrolase-like protein with peptidoglycan-binding domain